MTMKIRLALASTAALLVAAACVYFIARTPQAESLRMAAVEQQAADVELVGAADLTAAANPEAEAGGRSPVLEEPPGGVSAARGTNVLRVVLGGITEDDARMTTVTLTGVDKRAKWPGEIRGSWPCQGLTSEFDLDPFFARVAERQGNLRVDELAVEVDHPLHFLKTTRVPLSRGVELSSGQTVYEVRVRLVPPVFWPELTLDVRDADTKEHLADVELRCRTTAWMGVGQLPGTGGPFTVLGGGLSSPIVLLGGREADEPEERVAGLALGPAAGEAPQPAELSRHGRVRPERGIIMYARAPGYAWGSIVLDVSTGAEYELLLRPAAALVVRFSNVQLERYAELERVATLHVGGGVWFQGLDETLESDGLRLDALEPGEYAVSVEMGGASGKRHVLAREELSLAAGETRELVLALADPPAPPERATLGGVVSFPAFGGEEEVRLQLFGADYTYSMRDVHGSVDVELSLAEMEPVGGALPTWSFRLEDLPVGLYQVRLRPFHTSWMIELPAGGREDVELVIPELAEVLALTVDARTGERVPLDVIRYRHQGRLPGQVKNGWARADVEEPGRFRFWTAPGAVSISLSKIPSGLDYGTRVEDLELVPGLQSVRFELEPVYAIRFEFRDGGAVLARADGLWGEALGAISQAIRAVDHEGRLTTLSDFMTERLAEVSAPGVYEVSFEGVGTGRFLPIMPRRVTVRAGETAEVIVELRRK